jgi:hypothetical protein
MGLEFELSGTEYTEDDLAYDGSSHPQRRRLTPRERDILCRVISDILNVARLRYGPGVKVPIEEFNSVPIRVGEPEFLNVLAEVRQVINPREN